jgi:hypothetical protein
VNSLVKAENWGIAATSREWRTEGTPTTDEEL